MNHPNQVIPGPDFHFVKPVEHGNESSWFKFTQGSAEDYIVECTIFSHAHSFDPCIVAVDQFGTTVNRVIANYDDLQKLVVGDVGNVYLLRKTNVLAYVTV